METIEKRLDNLEFGFVEMKQEIDDINLIIRELCKELNGNWK